MLIRRAALLDGRTTDLRLDTRIREVAAGLVPHPGETVLDAAGGLVIPGLHDHHLHVRSAAAALHSVRVGPAEVTDGSSLGAVLRGAPVAADGWVRAIGYHDAVAGPLDRATLDEVGPPGPVRVQHRSGVQWTLNSAALARLGLSGHPDGTVRSADPRWSAALAHTEPDLTGLGAMLSGYGVTGVTDATPELTPDDVAALQDARGRGELPQRLHALAPGKRILHDDDLDLEELTAWIAAQHRRGPVAVHCVTAAQLVVTLAALRNAGHRPGDRIEHAAVVPDASLPDLAGSGVTVVTQPNFVAERGDQYRTDLPASEHHELWRVASLLRAGVPTALSTDAPFGDADPWAAMRAAVTRATPSGVVLAAAERISPRETLTMFLGHADRPAESRVIEPGAAGDVCVLSVPPPEALVALDADVVAATVIDGEVVYVR